MIMFAHGGPIRHKIAIPVTVDRLITRHIKDCPEMVVEVLGYLLADGEGIGNMPLVFSRNDAARHLLEDLRAVVVTERRRLLRENLSFRKREELDREAARLSVLLDAWNADGRDASDIGKNGGSQHGI